MQICEILLRRRAASSIQQVRKFFNTAKKLEPIKFETSKVLPFAQEHFFEVIKRVDDYQSFIPWISESKIKTETIVETYERGTKRGRFEAETKIGFQLLSFSYISHVSFEEPNHVVSESYENRIFEGLYSSWQIKSLGEDQCEVFYKINMTFRNPLYTQITNAFFDLLSKNINRSFEQRCQQLFYTEQMVLERKRLKQQKTLKESPQAQVRLSNQTNQKTKKRNHPEDEWIWGIDQRHFTDSQDSIAKTAVIEKKKQRDTIITQIRRLRGKTLISDLEFRTALAFLQTSDIFLRETQLLLSTFSQNEMTLVYHLKNLIQLSKDQQV